MTTDLEDRLRDTFERVMPLLYHEPAEEPGTTGQGSVVLIGSAARSPRSRRVLVAACAAIVVAMVATIAILRGGRDDVTPVNDPAHMSIPSVGASAPEIPADAPEWYGWIKPFLPPGFDHVAANLIAKGSIFYTAVDRATNLSLDIRIMVGPALVDLTHVTGTDPEGDVRQTDHGYEVRTRAHTDVSVECSVGDNAGDGLDYCAAHLDMSTRRAMALAIAERFPFDQIDAMRDPVPTPAGYTDLDLVQGLMEAALPNQVWQGKGDQQVEFGYPGESVPITSVAILHGVYPPDDATGAPVTVAYGSSSVGWLIRSGTAVRLFSAAADVDQAPQLERLLDGILSLALSSGQPSASPTSTSVVQVPTTDTTLVTTSSTPIVSGTANAVTYTVQAGDVLVRIAGWFCVTAQEIVDANSWTEGFDHSLAVGDVIRVPARACVRGLPSPTEPKANLVLVTGDNIGVLTATGLVSVGVGALNEGRISTGIVRTDFFDWPAHLADRVPTLPAGVPVVFAAGSNDGQMFLGTQDPVGSAAWVTEYTNRVLKVVDLVVGAGHPLIWIAPPSADDPALEAALDAVRGATEAALAGKAGVVYVDAQQILAGPDGGYTDTLTDPSGNPIVVRSADDNRITPAGQDLITQRVLLALEAQGFPVMNVDAFGTYTVQAGDYLGGIAARTGTTVDGIIAANGWTDESQVLVPGMKIRLPAKPDDPPITQATGLPTTTIG